MWPTERRWKLGNMSPSLFHVSQQSDIWGNDKSDRVHVTVHGEYFFFIHQIKTVVKLTSTHAHVICREIKPHIVSNVFLIIIIFYLYLLDLVTFLHQNSFTCHLVHYSLNLLLPQFICFKFSIKAFRMTFRIPAFPVISHVMLRLWLS